MKNKLYVGMKEILLMAAGLVLFALILTVRNLGKLVAKRKKSAGVVACLGIFPGGKTEYQRCYVYLEEEKDTIELELPKKYKIKEKDRVMLILKKPFLGDLEGRLICKL